MKTVGNKLSNSEETMLKNSNKKVEESLPPKHNHVIAGIKWVQGFV